MKPDTFVAALRASRQTYGDIADRISYSQRLLEMVATGERNVTPEIVARLIVYLREHSQELAHYADVLAGMIGELGTAQTKRQEEAMTKSDGTTAMRSRKMVELKVRLFTNDIPEKGKRRPGYAWTAGMVAVTSNPMHGLKWKKGQKPRPFNSMGGLATAIEDALIDAGVTLVIGRGGRSRKLYRSLGEVP